MNKTLLLFFAALFTTLSISAQTTRQGKDNGSTKGQKSDWAWTVQPFDHKVFIENRGQFDQLVGSKSKVLFGAQLGDNLFAYFTTNGVIYRQCVYPKLQAAKKELAEKKNYDPDKEEIKPVITYLSSQWEGSNPDVTLDAKQEQTDYYTYPTGKTTSVQVNIFKKIIYKNLYPGIDAEYTFFPDKQGFKYALIVHPGADLSKVKMKYHGDKGMSIDGNGDITIKSEVGDVVDHAPISMYQEGGNVTSSYNLSGEEESFNISNYDNTKTLVIDPWTWTSSPALATNKAYDLDYDNAGNVYVYGSSGTWQLAKFNSGGTKLWTFNATAISTGYYGDFACDKLSGKCYCTEGFNSTGMSSSAVSTAGALISTNKTVANLQEGWRDVWDACKSVIVVAGGSWQTTCDAGGVIDTNNNITPVNCLNENAVEEGHDMALLCMDPNGTQCYMATTQSAGDPTNFNNIMTQLPVPALTPFTYQTATGYTFAESNVAQYVGSYTANGLNGMACSINWLYIYDGATLKRVNKGTGSIVTTVTITGTSENWGGLDVDNCDNIYIGENSAVQVYNSALSLTTTYATSNTVYDVVLGTNYQSLYACGNGFLSYMPLPAPSTSITKTRTNASCGCTGTASAELYQCGNPITAGVTYAWSNGATTSSVSALCAGTYSITITTPTCPKNVYTDTVLIKTAGGGGLTVTTTVSNIKCNGGTGSATATTTGGTSPYTYTWTPAGGNAATATGLSAGTYTVSVTDNNGCTGSATATITQPAVLTESLTPTNIKCAGGTGSITSTVGGGTTAYTYSWVPSGGTGPNATGLTPGTYTLNVTDANGCIISASATITAPPALTATISTVAATCGNSDGSETVTVGGGTGTYTYSWAPSGGNAATASNLAAGNYTVTVTDANGCTITASGTVTNSGGETVSISGVTNELCNGGTTGSINTTTTGGTLPYTYSWTPSGQTTPNATNLGAGTYTVTVTDANGCTSTASATITEPPALTATTSVINVLCNGGTGSATVTPGGGTPGYSYSWAPSGGNAATATITAGTYTVTVTDANGCSITASATVTQPAALTATTTTTTATCGNSNGSATVTAGGGTGAYTYSWAPAGGNTATASNLSASTYTVTVTDANGCSITASATVANAGGETVSISGVTNVSCKGGSNGIINTTTTGGTSPYTYSWTPTSQTTPNASGLSAGAYTVTVTDANGCTATASATVTEPPLLTVITGGIINVSCNSGNNGSATATANGGTTAYTYAWTPSGGNAATASNLSAGTYTVTVTDANGCTATATATITQPAALTLTITNTNVSCNGGSDATATATVGGGTTPYTYNWMPGGNTNSNITGIGAGTYTVNVTDANGCTISASVTVTQPAPIVVAFTADTINGCAPLCTGFVDGTSDPGGVITKWKWSYSDGGSDTIQNPRHCFTNPGSYNVTLTVTDNHGCTSTLTIANMINVYSYPVPDFTFGPQPVTIINPTISFTDKSTDAYGIASWLWNFNDPTNDIASTLQNPSHNYGDTGVFCATLTVTNVHGCKDSVTHCVVISPQFTMYIPDAFSPNGDGINDVFQPKGDYLTDYKLYIFDRWGMQLFYSDDIMKGWAGTVNGKSNVCQEDTYVYLIEVTDNLGKKHSYLGKVTLVK